MLQNKWPIEKSKTLQNISSLSLKLCLLAKYSNYDLFSKIMWRDREHYQSSRPHSYYGYDSASEEMSIR